MIKLLIDWNIELSWLYNFTYSLGISLFFNLTSFIIWFLQYAEQHAEFFVIDNIVSLCGLKVTLVSKAKLYSRPNYKNGGKASPFTLKKNS